MRIDEIKVNPFGDEITAVQFKKIMNMIKNTGLDTDRRSASIKNQIINRWQHGERSIKKLEPDFERLGLNLRKALGEMEQ